jgi:hypothetical protein
MQYKRSTTKRKKKLFHHRCTIALKSITHKSSFQTRSNFIVFYFYQASWVGGLMPLAGLAGG